MVPLRPAARLRLSPVARALGLALLALPALCAAETDPVVLEQLKRLSERLQQVEKRNEELERRVRELTPTVTAAVPSRAAGPGAAATAEATGTPAAPQWGDRVQALEQEQRTLAQQVQGLVRPLDVPEGADAGPSFEGTVVAVGQHILSLIHI